MIARRPRCALFLSRDWGSVQATLPVAQALIRNENWRVEIVGLADNHAGVAGVLAQDGVIPAALDESAFARCPRSCMTAVLECYRPDIVISGSSPARGSRPETPEQYLIAAARAANIPSVGILDYWGFYEERFVSDGTRVDMTLLPDLLCVLDVLCRDDLVALGAPVERLTITHNPALDALVAEIEKQPSPSPELCAGYRHAVFASQPLDQDRTIRQWHWTQYQLFETFLDCLPVEGRWQVLVWPHPREEPRRWLEYAARVRENVRIDCGEARGASVLAHIDFMITSHSSASYQAALCDAPIISFRPFEWTRKLPVVDDLGISHLVEDADRLRDLLRGFDLAPEQARIQKIRRDLEARHVFYSDGRATPRVVAAIEHLLDG